MHTVFSLLCVSMTIYLLSSSISFTLFRRQWRIFFKHPQLSYIWRTLTSWPSKDWPAKLLLEVTQNSCIPLRNPFFPVASHVYTSRTKFQILVHTIHRCSLTETFVSNISVSRPFFRLLLLNGVLFTKKIRSTKLNCEHKLFSIFRYLFSCAEETFVLLRGLPRVFLSPWSYRNLGCVAPLRVPWLTYETSNSQNSCFPRD